MDRSAAITHHGVSKRFTITVIVLGLLLGTLAFRGANKKIVGLFHDDGIYAVVGKSLAEGDGYRILSLPAAPAQTKYPFLYSYLLSWLWAMDPVFPHNIALLKSLNVAILVAIFFAAIIYYRRSNGASAAGILFATIVCTNPVIFGFTDYLLSDLLLALLAVIALALCAGVNGEKASFAHILLLGATAGLACLTRSAALPLVFAGAIHAFKVRGWRGAGGFLAAAAFFVIPWVLWMFFHAAQPAETLFAYYVTYDMSGAPSGDLAAWIGLRLSIVAGNARYLCDMFDLFYLTPLLPGSGLMIGFFSLWGMVISLRRDNSFSSSLFLFSLTLLLIWPFHPGRYLASLVPLIVMYLFRGMSSAHSWLKARWADYSAPQWLATLTWSPVAIVLLLNGVWLSSYLFMTDHRTTRGLYGRRMPYSWAGFEEAFAWLRANSAPEDLLATAYDPMYYLYTGRRAIRPALHRPATYFYPYGEASPDVGAVEEIKPQLAKLGVNFLIIDPMDGYAEGKATVKLLEDLVLTFGNRAERVFTSSDGGHRIYRIVGH